MFLLIVNLIGRKSKINNSWPYAFSIGVNVLKRRAITIAIRAEITQNRIRHKPAAYAGIVVSCSKIIKAGEIVKVFCVN